VLLENLSFSYDGDRDVLRGLSLSLVPGDFLVVLGANGAGKSTLCYLLAGVIPHIYGGRRRGTVLVDGLDPWDHPMYEMARHCGIVLQDPETQLFMPTLEMELGFGPSNLGVPRDEITRRTKHFLNLVGLEGFERRPPKALSGGQKQRAALASVLTMLPRLLILDEPTSQLDPVGSFEVADALRTLARSQDMAVVMTTHKVEEVLGIATHCLLLREGVPVRQGRFAEVVADVEALEAAGVQAPVGHRVLHALGAPADVLRRVEPALVPETIRQFLGCAEDSPPVPGDKGGGLPPAGTAQPGGAAGSPAAPEDPAASGVVAPEKPVLQVEDLVVTYPGSPPVTALQGVSFALRQGEFLGIVGQNGSGKTTLVKALVGLVRPSRGRIIYRGEDLVGRRTGDITRRMGLVLQNPDYQLFNVSVEEEVAFGLKNLGLDQVTISRRVREVLEAVGLYELKDLFPFKLSFGDRRKLSVACVLAMGPEVLILDEPTTAQDYRGRYLLAELADGLRREGRTVIMITHDMDLVARYATRLLVMHGGQVLLDGPTSQVFRQEEVLARAWLRPPAAHVLARKLGLCGEIMTPEALLAHLATAAARQATGQWPSPAGAAGWPAVGRD